MKTTVTKYETDFDDLIEKVKDAVRTTVVEEYWILNQQDDKKVLLSKNQVCKMLGVGWYTIDKYVEDGLVQLPDGRFSKYHLNEYLGKYNGAKNRLNKD